MVQNQMKTIRAKKLGVLIRDAREVSGKTKKECAEAIGVSPATFGSYENGTKSPTLPQLEIYAYYLNIPFEHFWGNQALSELPPPTSKINAGELMAVRDESISNALHNARTAANLSLKELGGRAGISPRRLKSFETGKQSVSLPELEAILAALELSIQDVMGGEGAVQNWISKKDAIDQFLELPSDLQSFVGKPVNRPFIELAEKLSQMPVDKLRAVAEGLLEITF